MMGWIILGVLIIALMLVYKIRHTKHRIYLVLMILLTIFVYTTGAAIIKESGIDVFTLKGALTGGKLYFNWLTQIFSNARSLAGNAVKMSWFNATAP